MLPAGRWSRELGRAGFLKLCVARRRSTPDVRSLAIARAILARAHGLADFAFAMQGLGSGAISLFGSDAQKAEWLPKVAARRSHRRFCADRTRNRQRRRQYRHDRAERRRRMACSTARKATFPTAPSPMC